MMKRILASVTMCLVTSLSVAQEEGVFEAQGLRVSEGDVDYYISSFVTPKQEKDWQLTVEDVKHIIELLYVNKALAAQAKTMNGVDSRRARWLGDFQVSMALKEALLNIEAQNALENVDFETTAKDLYTKQADQFKTDIEVRAAHILISTRTRSDAKAMEKAQKLLSSLRDGGDFTKIAQEHSEDPSVSRNQGDLGFFGKGKMVPNFEAAAYSLELGMISEPVKTPFGYHLIKVLEKRGGEPRPFEKVKPLIVSELRKQLVSKYKQDRVNSLAESVVLDDSTLENLVTQFNSASKKKN
ncbi:peptidylprolyl isomerase [uncultured Pseudoteredinibacter sp.]|uniref:peptidylprolyl isomerase n=1 Tax=uncultured Pseudoteredinibacter sp. TaxID=1641701 RepID=UPI002623B004|nr:peptidylprolyl isomerase [uncultured Pseudoteredinibacter sp.]